MLLCDKNGYLRCINFFKGSSATSIRSMRSAFHKKVEW